MFVSFFVLFLATLILFQIILFCLVCLDRRSVWRYRFYFLLILFVNCVCIKFVNEYIYYISKLQKINIDSICFSDIQSTSVWPLSLIHLTFISFKGVVKKITIFHLTCNTVNFVYLVFNLKHRYLFCLRKNKFQVKTFSIFNISSSSLLLSTIIFQFVCQSKKQEILSF